MSIQVDQTAPRVRVGYAGREVAKPPNWHGLVTVDLLFNNLATGLFLAAAIGELVRPELIGPAARLAYPVALLLLLCDLLFLTLDLGSPTRFHHMLRVFKPTSPMSLGTWSLTAYSLPLTSIAAIDAMAWLGWLRPSSSGIRTIRIALLVLGLLPALASATYKGVLFSTTSQPGWKDARWLGAYLINSAMTYGAAGLYALALRSGYQAAAASIRIALAALFVSNLVCLMLLAVELEPALVRCHSRSALFWLALLAAGVGVLLPLGLLAVAGGPIAGYASLPCVVLGAIAWRHAIVMLPHAAVAVSRNSPGGRHGGPPH
jgi:hypothetical protein